MRLEFRADTTNLWGFGKTYDLIVEAGTPDGKGNTLAGEYRSRFTTETFRVSYTSYRDGQTITYLPASVGFEFTGPIDLSTIIPSVSVSPSPASGPYNYWTNGFSFYPSLGFRANQTYTISVGTSLKAADGTPLQEPLVLRLSTAPFQVRYTYPSDGGVLSPGSSFSVDMNSFVDPNTVASSVSITPAQGGAFSSSSSSSYFYKSGPYAANTSYTVVISTGLRSMAGDTLAAPYRFTFRTGPN